MEPDLSSIDIDSIAKTSIGPGCSRRDLPPMKGTRAWIVDIEPGHTWPEPDHHDANGETVLVLSGELIEDSQTFGPGTYITYGPNSSHQPRSETGVRLFGLNAA